MNIEQIQIGNVTYSVVDSGAQRAVSGKGLSTNDYTDADKAKVAASEANTIETIKVNGTALVPDANDAVDITVPSVPSISTDIETDYNEDGKIASPSAVYNYVEATKTTINTSLSGKADKSEMSIVSETGNATITLKSGTSATVLTSHQDISGKQDTISDLETIRSGAALGATAIQSHQDITGKQDVIDDLSTIRSGAALGATAYQKPGTGIPAADLATGVIPDVSNFITNSVNNLTNYYTKSDTYTQTEVNNLIAAINQFKYEIAATTSAVSSLASNVLYLIGPTGSGSDKYEEYVYANNEFVKIGDTTIDLSGYVTSAQLNSALANYNPQSSSAFAAGTGVNSVKLADSIAIGQYSVAEGYKTIAYGDYSHSEGYSTIYEPSRTLTGDGVIYTLNTSSNKHRLAVGKLIVCNNAYAFVTAINGNVITVSSTLGTITEPASYTVYTGGIAYSTYSHVEGKDTIAKGNASHAEGAGAVAAGVASHAEGRASALSDNSHAEGDSTIAKGVASHIEGEGTTTDSGSQTENAFTLTGTGAASPYNYTASINSHGLKVGSVLSYNGTFVYVTAVDGATITTSTSLGELTTASVNIHRGITLAKNTHVEGWNCTALGNQSHAEGTGTLAYDNQAHAEGYASTAFGKHSHAEGSTTVASGQGSHAEGYQSKSGGAYSHSEGRYSVTQNASEHAEGSYNKSNYNSGDFGDAGNTISAIGIGTADNQRKNAIEVMQNGLIYIYGVNGYDGTNPDPASNGNSLQAALLNLEVTVDTNIFVNPTPAEE